MWRQRYELPAIAWRRACVRARSLRTHGKSADGWLDRQHCGRTLQAAEIVGIRAVLVHTLSPSAKQFYLQAGFTEAPAESDDAAGDAD